MAGIWYSVLVLLITFTLKRLKSKVKDVNERVSSKESGKKWHVLRPEGQEPPYVLFLLPAPHSGGLLPPHRLRTEREWEEARLGKQPGVPGLRHRHLGITGSPHLFPDCPFPLCCLAALHPDPGADPATVRGLSVSTPSVPGHIRSLGFNHLCFSTPRSCTQPVLNASLLDILPGQSEGPLQQVIN